MHVDFDYTTDKGETIRVKGEVVENRSSMKGDHDHFTVLLDTPLVKPDRHRPQTHIMVKRNKVASAIAV